jgi:hypothetical protein
MTYISSQFLAFLVATSWRHSGPGLDVRGTNSSHFSHAAMTNVVDGIDIGSLFGDCVLIAIALKVRFSFVFEICYACIVLHVFICLFRSPDYCSRFDRLLRAGCSGRRSPCIRQCVLSVKHPEVMVLARRTWFDVC